MTKPEDEDAEASDEGDEHPGLTDSESEYKVDKPAESKPDRFSVNRKLDVDGHRARDHTQKWPRQHQAEVALRRAQAPDIAKYERQLEAARKKIEANADAYDMATSPHTGGARFFARSDVGLAPVTEECSQRQEKDQDAKEQASMPKPQVTLEELQGAIQKIEDSIPKPEVKVTAEEWQHRSQGGCSAIGTGTTLCPLFRNGGDLGGFERNGWIPMPCPMVIDSGAAETVLPLSWFKDHKIMETDASRSGVYYRTANGEKVYNKGEKTLTMCHFEGSHHRDMTFQVANVHKALGSANKIVRNGNRIVMDLDDEGNDFSFIESKSTGERLWLREREGVYLLEMLIAPPAGQNGVNAATLDPSHPPESGFRGPGR